MKDDYRNYLFESFVKVVDEFKPKLFVFENVPGMLSAEPGGIKVTQRVHEAFAKIGYQISAPEMLKQNVYSADDFEVPQKRRRLIIVGVNQKENLDLSLVYKSIDSLKSQNKKVVRDAIKDLPKFRPLTSRVKENGVNISHRVMSENEEISLIKKPRPGLF